MRIDKTPLNEETKAKIVQMLNTAEDKTQAITDAMEAAGMSAPAAALSGRTRTSRLLSSKWWKWRETSSRTPETAVCQNHKQR